MPTEQSGRVTGHQVLGEVLARSFNLATAEPVQRHRLRATREALLGARQVEQVRRSGNEEAARTAIVLHRVLHGPEELRDSLDLIDAQQARHLSYEPVRVGPRRLVGRSRIQAHQQSPAGLQHLPGQGALSDLPGSLDDRDRGVLERLLHERTYEPPPQRLPVDRIGHERHTTACELPLLAKFSRIRCQYVADSLDRSRGFAARRPGPLNAGSGGPL